MDWGVLITLFCIGAGIYTFLPRRRSSVASSRAVVRPVANPRRRPSQPLLPALARSLSYLAGRAKLEAISCYYAVLEGWERAHQPRRPHLPYVKPALVDDLAYQPLILDVPPVNDQTKTTNEPNEAPQTTPPAVAEDVDLTKDRIGAALFLGSKGLTDEVIARIVKKDPAAILEAMRIEDMRAYRVAKVMAGDYAKNLKAVAAVVEQGAVEGAGNAQV